MKKLLTVVLLCCFISGFANPARPLSYKAKIGIGAAALVAGGVGLWYYFKKLNEENEKEESERKNNGNKAGIGISAAAVLAGAGLVAKGAYDYATQDQPPPATNPFYPFRRNIFLEGGIGRPRVNFFRTVMGVDEQTFSNMTGAQKTQVITALEQQGIHFGQFNAHSINDLRNRTANMPAFQGQWQCQVIRNPNVDVKTLQADPQNNDAVFQVASNFNTLEAGDYFGSNNPINQWQAIMAQGEQASMSAFPGAVLKKYMLGPINLLDQLVRQEQEVVQMSRNNIYVARIPNIQNLQNHYGDIKVGYHGGISVTHGRNFQNIIIRNQRINQVFVAALNINRGTILEGNRRLNRTRLGFRRRTTTIFLQAAYEGTVRAAFLHGKRKVFLTLVGGGVFGNTLREIGDSLVDALRFAREKHMHIVIVCRMGQDNRILDQRNFFDNLQRIIAVQA